MKTKGLISLSEEISWQPNMAAVTELSVITLRQADSGKEQAGQKEVQSVVGGEKKYQEI